MMLAAACGRQDHEGPPPQPPPAPQAPAAPAPDDAKNCQPSTSRRFCNTSRRSSSDEFEGRAPGTKGEDLTVAYLTDEFKKLGLKPGNPDGTYDPEGAARRHHRAEPAPLIVTKGSAAADASSGSDDVVAWTQARGRRRVDRRLEVVFVGYGVDAPEFDWDDFKGVDVKGKTLVMLVNDPPVPDPADPAKLDPKTFGGKAMTYYGRWTYKFEKGARKGAAAVLIVHETGPAGYPFAVVQGNLGEKFDLVDARQEHGPRRDRRLDHARRGEDAVQDGGPGLRRAEEAGGDARVQAGAARASTASIAIQNTLRTIDSQNVVGEARRQRSAR